MKVNRLVRCILTANHLTANICKQKAEELLYKEQRAETLQIIRRSMETLIIMNKKKNQQLWAKRLQNRFQISKSTKKRKMSRAKTMLKFNIKRIKKTYKIQKNKNLQMLIFDILILHDYYLCFKQAHDKIGLFSQINSFKLKSIILLFSYTLCLFWKSPFEF